MLRQISRLTPYALAFASSLCIMTLELVAARLVARHVGASLHVWTSVIGIVLGGICLGNVLGGRLVDRLDARHVVGPLFAMGAALTLGCLWMNAAVGNLPGLDRLAWSLRTLVVVTLDFLVPATVIGMIGPVVAKIAVDQSARAGSAIGDVYFWGAIGSIAGTFLTGFVLMYEATTTTIVHAVAAGLMLLGALTMVGRGAKGLTLLAAVVLAVGCLGAVDQAILTRIVLGGTRINPVLMAGHALALAAGLVAALGLRGSPKAGETPAAPYEGVVVTAGSLDPSAGPKLGDLAMLAFLISLAFMSLEMVAGRLVARHLGSSIYGWTSVIGVLLGGLSLGNLLGGKIADRVRNGKQASWLFLAASLMTLFVLIAETPPKLIFGQEIADEGAFLGRAIGMSGVPWGLRILAVVALVFFIPAITMGTVSPVVAKLAIDRLRGQGRTGRAIGEVYAWGMVGSLLGTFLTGFLLIDVLGTKGLVIALSALLAIAATGLGTIWHAAWAGIPLGLCILAFAPTKWLAEQGAQWGVREEAGDPGEANDGMAYADESNYYYIKVLNENVPNPADPDSEGYLQKRTLVLDNLIHGYFLLDHPEHIEYDYEYIYAQVARRLLEAKGGAEVDARDVPFRSLFLGGGSYTFPRYLQHAYTKAECDVAEIDPAVTEANHIALGLPRDTPIRTAWGDARQYVEKSLEEGGAGKYDLVFGDAFNDFSVPWHLTTREFNDKIAALLNERGIYMINIIDVYRSDETALRKALQDGQTGAIAEALRAAGNDRTDARDLAKVVRVLWEAGGDALRVDPVFNAGVEALEGLEARGPATRAEIEAALRAAIALVPDRYEGEAVDLAKEASEAIARVQYQRDQTAATAAVSNYLRDRKIEAGAAAFKDAGIRLKAGSLAEAVVDNWFGGRELLAEVLRQYGVEGDLDSLATSLERALNAVEAELKESPPLLARRLILSPTELGSRERAEIEGARSAPALRAILEKAGLREHSRALAEVVAGELARSLIRGDFNDLGRRAEQAVRGFAGSPESLAAAGAQGIENARGLGAFLGSWARTARLTFEHVSVFGTDADPGRGLRETFVVVASKAPLDLRELGKRPGDPKFEQDDANFEPQPYSAAHLEALDLRSRRIILTDDYAPVENLLAPVAATRGEN